MLTLDQLVNHGTFRHIKDFVQGAKSSLIGPFGDADSRVLEQIYQYYDVKNTPLTTEEKQSLEALIRNLNSHEKRTAVFERYADRFKLDPVCLNISPLRKFMESIHLEKLLFLITRGLSYAMTYSIATTVTGNAANGALAVGGQILVQAAMGGVNNLTESVVESPILKEIMHNGITYAQAVYAALSGKPLASLMIALGNILPNGANMLQNTDRYSKSDLPYFVRVAGQLSSSIGTGIYLLPGNSNSIAAAPHLPYLVRYTPIAVPLLAIYGMSFADSIKKKDKPRAALLVGLPVALAAGMLALSYRNVRAQSPIPPIPPEIPTIQIGGETCYAPLTFEEIQDMLAGLDPYSMSPFQLCEIGPDGQIQATPRGYQKSAYITALWNMGESARVLVNAMQEIGAQVHHLTTSQGGPGLAWCPGHGKPGYPNGEYHPLTGQNGGRAGGYEVIEAYCKNPSCVEADGQNIIYHKPIGAKGCSEKELLPQPVPVYASEKSPERSAEFSLQPQPVHVSVTLGLVAGGLALLGIGSLARKMI